MSVRLVATERRTVRLLGNQQRTDLAAVIEAVFVCGALLLPILVGVALASNVAMSLATPHEVPSWICYPASG